MRDFEYNADDIAAEREQRNQMGTDLKKQLVWIFLFLFFPWKLMIKIHFFSFFSYSIIRQILLVG